MAQMPARAPRGAAGANKPLPAIQGVTGIVSGVICLGLSGWRAALFVSSEVVLSGSIVHKEVLRLGRRLYVRGEGAHSDVRPHDVPRATFPLTTTIHVKAGFTPFRKAAHPTCWPKGVSGKGGSGGDKSPQPNLMSGEPPQRAIRREGLLVGVRRYAVRGDLQLVGGGRPGREGGTG